MCACFLPGSPRKRDLRARFAAATSTSMAAIRSRQVSKGVAVVKGLVAGGTGHGGFCTAKQKFALASRSWITMPTRWPEEPLPAVQQRIGMDVPPTPGCCVPSLHARPVCCCFPFLLHSRRKSRRVRLSTRHLRRVPQAAVRPLGTGLSRQARVGTRLTIYTGHRSYLPCPRLPTTCLIPKDATHGRSQGCAAQL